MSVRTMRSGILSATTGVFFLGLCAVSGCADSGTEVGVTRAHGGPPATPAPEDFDPIAETSAVGALPGQVSVTADGVFSYVMPIEVPPGRNGMQPSLAVRYASGGGETVLGQGFSLVGLSAMGRCLRTYAQDGERRPLSLNDQDRLCLNGARLVAEPGAPYGSPTASYRPEFDPHTRVEERTRLGDGVSGATGFVVTLADGTEQSYGGSVEGRILATASTGQRVVIAWLLTETRDLNGNTVEYVYEQVSPPTAVGSDDTPITRLAEIRYTGRRTGAAVEHGTRSVRLEYSEIPRRPRGGGTDTPPGGTAPLLGASTPFDGYALGAQQWRQAVYPLTHLRTYVGEDLVREYRFEGHEDPASRQWRLDRVRACVDAPPSSPSDLDATGLVCMPPTVFHWQEHEVIARPNVPGDDYVDETYGLQTFQTWEAPFDRVRRHTGFACGTPESPMRCWEQNTLISLDVNGDGATDLLYERHGDDKPVIRFGVARPAIDQWASVTGQAPYSGVSREVSVRGGSFMGGGRYINSLRARV